MQEEKKGQSNGIESKGRKSVEILYVDDDSQMKKIYSRPNCRRYNNFFNLN